MDVVGGDFFHKFGLAILSAMRNSYMDYFFTCLLVACFKIPVLARGTRLLNDFPKNEDWQKHCIGTAN